MERRGRRRARRVGWAEERHAGLSRALAELVVPFAQGSPVLTLGPPPLPTHSPSAGCALGKNHFSVLCAGDAEPGQAPRAWRVLGALPLTENGHVGAGVHVEGLVGRSRRTGHWGAPTAAC